MISAEVTPEDSDDFNLSATRLGRVLASPTALTALVLIVGACALAFGIVHHRSGDTNATSPLPQTSTAVPLQNSSLSVKPLAQSTGTSASGNTNLQSAAGGNSATSSTPSAVDSQLGAGASSSLGGGSASSYQSTAGGLNQFSGQSLIANP